MRKLLFTVSIVLILISCDTESMNNDNNGKKEQGYLTITYHSEGHTSGEVPEDSKYPIVATGYIYEKDFAEPYKAGPVPIEQGTLKKERCLFRGWRVIDSDDPESFNSPWIIGQGLSKTFFFMDGNDKRYELHAVWEEF